MIEIANNVLKAFVIDPVADADRMGGRYCWGGYCARARDKQGRELLSGPEFPGRPSAFNGEGVPEVFRFHDKQGGKFLTFDEDGRGLIIGGGLASVDPAERPAMGEVYEPCRWEVTRESSAVTMRTAQAYGNRAYRLTRRLELDGCTLKSITRLENAGVPFVLQWYAHPFFPLTDGLCGVRFSVPTTVGETQGFRTTSDGRLEMREDCVWDQAGQFEWLRREPGHPLCADIRHPFCSRVRVDGDFPVDMMPVWANTNTLSIEPYFTRPMACGQTHEWSLKYAFVG